MFTGLEHLMTKPQLPYVYSPLDATNHQLRLLHILPGTNQCRPRCRIETVSLEANVKFVALSYAWGTSKNRKCIEVDGRALYVTKNLFEALVQFQCELDSHDKLLLWADAVRQKYPAAFPPLTTNRSA